MMIGRREIKAAMLAMLIAVGLCVQARMAAAETRETLVVAGGCFWCVEADFEKVPGVLEAESGFAGGTVANPTYKQVTRERLLHLFLRSVDPTDAGGQFCDRGESYTTAIFVSGPAEKALAEGALAEAERALGQSIVTPVRHLDTFWPADSYHQDYYKSHGIVLTRFGPRQKASAYTLYRKACGRDARVKALWGGAAPFAGHS